MKRKGFTILAVLVCVVGAFGLAHATGTYATAFKTEYSTSPLLAAPNPLDSQGRNCLVCHVDPGGGGTRTPYGEAFRGAHTGTPAAALAAIANLDSDGDGSSNITEINAGFYPGDKGSVPPPAPPPGDTTPPVVSAFSIPATATSLTVGITTFTATDAGGSGVTGYMVTSDSTIPNVSDGGWTITPPASYTFATPGTKTLYAWAKDEAGNISVPLNASTTITLPDKTAPVVSAFSIPATATSLTVGITTFTATDAVGVTGYMVTADSTIPNVSDGGWTSTSPASYTCASAGDKTLYAWAKDAAGNISVPLNASTTITLPDKTAPVVSAFSIPATATSLTVGITTFTATDDQSVAGYLLTETSAPPSAASASGWNGSAPASYTFASAGPKTLYAWAKDGAGNISASLNAKTTITLPDNIAPVVTAFTMPSASSSLTVAITTFTATDDQSVAGYLLTETSAPPSASALLGWNGSAPASYTFASAGPKTLYAWAKDGAGNVSTGVVSETVTITLSDATAAPVITEFTISSRSSSPIIPVTLSATDDKGVTGYLVTEAVTKPTAADPRWRTTPPNSHTFRSGGHKTLYAWAKDADGNISARATSHTAIQWSGRTHRSDDERSDDRRRDD